MDRVTLSNFTIDTSQFPNYFSIGEIRLSGQAAPPGNGVPAPATVALLGLGLLGLGRRRKV